MGERKFTEKMFGEWGVYFCEKGIGFFIIGKY